jgi:hypothetical protein
MVINKDAKDVDKIPLVGSDPSNPFVFTRNGKNPSDPNTLPFVAGTMFFMFGVTSECKQVRIQFQDDKLMIPSVKLSTTIVAQTEDRLNQVRNNRGYYEIIIRDIPMNYASDEAWVRKLEKLRKEWIQTHTPKPKDAPAEPQTFRESVQEVAHAIKDMVSPPKVDAAPSKPTKVATDSSKKKGRPKKKVT